VTSSKEKNQMRVTKAILGVVALAVLVGLTPMASAQGVKFLGVGSSAMFTGSAVATFNSVCSQRTGSDCHHYSIKGKNSSDGNNYAQAVDGRNAGIPVEAGNLWVVWDNKTSPITVWAYLTVDSIVGNRCFFATPRCQLQVDSGVLTTAGMNLIASNLFFNAQTGLNQADDSSLPSGVLSVVQSSFTAALSDIRPDDAKFETNRILKAYSATSLAGLGYGTPSANCPNATALIGCQVLGTWGGAATPVQFSLSGGKDPFTLLKVPATTAIQVGGEPIVFIYNNTGPGLSGGGFKDITFGTATKVFNGTLGLAQDIGGTGSNPLSVILREPLSGTMTTTEFNTFRVALAPSYAPAKGSQEKGINLAVGSCPGLGCPNPLNLASGDGGTRFRAIGTGQVISGVSGVGGIKNLADSVGYTFFSFGNVAPIAGEGGVGRYVTLDGVDPIAASYTDGTLPTCTAPCPVTPGTSFPHLRDGSYRTWTILRAITDKSGANFTNTQAIVTASQNLINSTVPDFVPAVATPDGDPGMTYYKSHFKQAGATKGTISNGNSGQAAENGGDVGGCPFQKATQPAQYCFQLNGTPTKTTEPVPCNYPLNQRTACDLSPGH
jgi:hypothetical protein